MPPEVLAKEEAQWSEGLRHLPELKRLRDSRDSWRAVALVLGIALLAIFVRIWIR